MNTQTQEIPEDLAAYWRVHNHIRWVRKSPNPNHKLKVRDFDGKSFQTNENAAIVPVVFAGGEIKDLAYTKGVSQNIFRRIRDDQNRINFEISPTYRARGYVMLFDLFRDEGLIDYWVFYAYHVHLYKVRGIRGHRFPRHNLPDAVGRMRRPHRDIIRDGVMIMPDRREPDPERVEEPDATDAVADERAKRLTAAWDGEGAEPRDPWAEGEEKSEDDTLEPEPAE